MSQSRLIRAQECQPLAPDPHTEFALLRVFLRHPGRVLSRDALHQQAWGHSYQLGSNSIEVYVGYLRRKLGSDVIETVRGWGYRFGAKP